MVSLSPHLSTAGKDDHFQLISCGADKSIMFRNLDKVCPITHTHGEMYCSRVYTQTPLALLKCTAAPLGGPLHTLSTGLCVIN